MITPKLIGNIIFTFILGITIVEISVILLFPAIISKSIIYPMCKSISEQIWWHYRAQCHQMPIRSLFFENIQLPVCNRCLFIRIGEFVVCFLIFFVKGDDNFFRNLMIAYSCLIPPIIIEIMLKLFYNYHSGFWIVSINGLFIGIVFYSFYAILILFLKRYKSWKSLYCEVLNNLRTIIELINHK